MRTILVVDDSPTIRKMVRAALADDDKVAATVAAPQLAGPTPPPA